jgi:hypothetical protein
VLAETNKTLLYTNIFAKMSMCNLFATGNEALLIFLGNVEGVIKLIHKTLCSSKFSKERACKIPGTSKDIKLEPPENSEDIKQNQKTPCVSRVSKRRIFSISGTSMDIKLKFSGNVGLPKSKDTQYIMVMKIVSLQHFRWKAKTGREKVETNQKTPFTFGFSNHHICKIYLKILLIVLFSSAKLKHIFIKKKNRRNKI